MGRGAGARIPCVGLGAAGRGGLGAGGRSGGWADRRGGRIRNRLGGVVTPVPLHQNILRDALHRVSDLVWVRTGLQTRRIGRAAG